MDTQLIRNTELGSFSALNVSRRMYRDIRGPGDRKKVRMQETHH